MLSPNDAALFFLGLLGACIAVLGLVWILAGAVSRSMSSAAATVVVSSISAEGRGAELCNQDLFFFTQLKKVNTKGSRIGPKVGSGGTWSEGDVSKPIVDDRTGKEKKDEVEEGRR